MQVTIRRVRWKVGLITAACVGAAIFGVVELYRHTKEAYRAVGFNDGTVAADVRVMQRISDVVGKITVCTTEEQSKATEIVAAKSEALYLIVSGSGAASFCRSR